MDVAVKEEASEFGTSAEIGADASAVRLEQAIPYAERMDENRGMMTVAMPRSAAMAQAC